MPTQAKAAQEEAETCAQPITAQASTRPQPRPPLRAKRMSTVGSVSRGNNCAPTPRPIAARNNQPTRIPTANNDDAQLWAIALLGLDFARSKSNEELDKTVVIHEAGATSADWQSGAWANNRSPNLTFLCFAVVEITPSW